MLFVLRRASEVHACTRVPYTEIRQYNVQAPNCLLWVNLMMTSLHSYMAFVFMGISPEKDEEDCANYLIGTQSMMLAGVLAGNAREPPGVIAFKALYATGSSGHFRQR